MADITVPTAAPLASVHGVELIQTGQWDISTGTATFTRDDLAAAVGAQDCPAVRRPILKLGHTDPRFDGEPAVGFVDAMATINSGHTLIGDYVGMPGWLGPVLPSAWPDRSIEGWWDFQCQLGHVHPFVVTAVALLGVSRPGIGTLQSLQDVADLYGVAAGAPEPAPSFGHAVVIHCKGAAPMPNPSPLQVAATVTSEDVRRAYYETTPWSVWICEMQLEPLQLITVDDLTGKYARVPITINGDDFEFGEAVPVEIQYVDTTGTPAAASAGAGRLVYASRAESRPGPPPRAAGPEAPPVEPAAGPTPTPEGEASMPALDEGLRERLGLAADADEAAILAAVDELTETATAPPAPVPAAASPALPPGTVAIDEATLAELRERAEQGAAARTQQLTESRDRAIDDAVKAGKIPPARVEHWQKAWAADPDGTRQTLASLAPGLVPIEDIGEPGGDDALDADWDRLHSVKGA
ncbi:phage protease [Streptosporangium sp. NBC_01810]|uniref:phage protease n=1 Tax=Streptosporangium sp. NBC_01810 TaxID=2975951 RepID=UPI002DD9922E|nr:phage protease [Streptosporangium sp. NBC_01810]WSA27426.1 phage protease [Streptosporangium sp. NBC_01810]